ncbi:MAG: sensor domain-containing diguanylate cyclase [Vulcanimicrobiota bacterium]
MANLPCLQHQFVLTARHAKTGEHVDFVLDKSSYSLGRSTRGDASGKLSINFDPTLSRDHASLVVGATKVVIKAVQNKHPLVFNGSPQTEFSMVVGESFSSGQTIFELGLDTGLEQTVDLFVTPERMEQLQASNPRETLMAILKIQPLLAQFHQPEPLFAALLPLLKAVVPSASALLAIRMGADGRQQVIFSEGTRGRVLHASETLVRRCLNENQSVYHIWQDVSSALEPTAVMGASWALAAPVPSTPESYVIYALGMESFSPGATHGPAELDRSVLALIADLVSKHLEGRRAHQLALQVQAERDQRLLSENLRNLSRSASSTLDARVVLEQLLAYLEPVVHYHRAFGYLKLNGEFRPFARRGQDVVNPPVLDARSPVHLLLKMHGAEPICLDGDSPETEVMGLDANWQVLLLPLTSQQEVQGLAVLCRYGCFTDNQVELAGSFAAQVGLSIHNARLFARVRNQAIYDELTGLANRRQFFNTGGHLWQSAPRLCLILFDIDRFKSINDTHGHDVGDIALKHVAAVCRRSLRECENLARLGGEEFALVLPVELSVALQMAERLRRGLETSPCQVSAELMLVITVSLGVAERQPNTTSLETLLKQADECLYRAKSGGRNRVEH